MNEQRVYPVRDPEIVARGQAAYRAKIEKNIASGFAAFSSGEFTPFKGWHAEDSRKIFDLILELDDPSRKEITGRVIEPLHLLAKKHGIQAIYPGTGDGPAHANLQPGKFVNLAPEQIKNIQDWLLSNQSHLGMIAKILQGLIFHHDTLVIGPNSYICASEFGNEQGGAFKARKAIARIMQHAQLIPQSETGSFAPASGYLDIFHTSVMRITEKAPSENLSAFAEEAYKTVGEDLKRNPIPVTVRDLFRGMAIDYQREHIPDRVLP